MQGSIKAQVALVKQVRKASRNHACFHRQILRFDVIKDGALSLRPKGDVKNNVSRYETNDRQGRLFSTARACFVIVSLAWLLTATATSLAQQVERGLVRIGGFRCANVKSVQNDSSLDLYELGKWSNESLRMDIWKRKGVPFWYPQETGMVRVAGAAWRPDLGDDISSREAGGRAQRRYGTAGRHGIQ